MTQRAPIRRISAKRLAELGGKMPFSTIRLRSNKFAHKAKPRKRGISQERKAGFQPRIARRNTAKHSAGGAQPAPIRRFNRIARHVRVKPMSDKQRKILRRLAAIRRRWWRESELSGVPLMCGICHFAIREFCDLNSDHVIPGQLGGGKGNSESNLQEAHWWCNMEKGSKRNFRKEAA